MKILYIILILIGIFIYLNINKLENFNISGVVDLKNGLSLRNFDRGTYETYDLKCESIVDNGRHVPGVLNSQNYNRTKNFRLKSDQVFNNDVLCGIHSDMPSRGDTCIIGCNNNRLNREIFTCNPPIKVSTSIHGRISDCNKSIVLIRIPDDVTLILYVDFGNCLDVSNFVTDNMGRYISFPSCINLNTQYRWAANVVVEGVEDNVGPRMYRGGATIPEIYLRTDYIAILMYGLKSLTSESSLNNKKWNEVYSFIPEGSVNNNLYLCSDNTIVIDFDILTGSNYLQSLDTLPNITDDATLQAEVTRINAYKEQRRTYMVRLGFLDSDFIDITIDNLCETDELDIVTDLTLFQDSGVHELWGRWFNFIGLKFIKCSAVMRVLNTIYLNEKVVFQLFTCLFDGGNELRQYYFDVPYIPPESDKQWQYALYGNEWKSGSHAYESTSRTEDFKLPCPLRTRFSLSKSRKCASI